jgi:hypothetical protein
MPVVSVNCEGTDIRESKEHLIAAIGMKDVVIVQTKKITLVGNKNDPDFVEGLLQIIEDIGNEEGPHADVVKR